MNNIIKRLFNIKNKYKATAQNEGEKWAILLNPQGTRDWNEEPIYREGIIKDVDSFGFVLDFGSSKMICTTLKNLKKL